MSYIDAYVIPVTTKKTAAYVKMAKLGRKVWLEHGALGYMEAMADDVPVGKVTSFPRGLKLKKTETVWVSFVIYKSRKHRDQVLAKVMQDKRFEPYMSGKVKLPFDGKRMILGGFKVMVG